MQAVTITADRREAWNNFVAANSSYLGHMQSWEWGEFKALLGWQPIRLAVEDQGQIVACAQMLIKTLPLQLMSFAYVPRGPLVAWQDEATTTCLLQAMHAAARQHKAVFLRMEPPLEDDPTTHDRLQSYGFQANSNTNQPRSTMIVDLKSDSEALFNSLSKNTRKKIRTTQNKGVSVRVGDEKDFDTFYEVMQSTGKRAEFPIRSRTYYDTEYQVFSKVGRARLSFATYEGTDIAVEMTFSFGRKAASFHGGFIADYPQLKVNHLLVWEAIRWAAEQGCDSFDLWGIPDEIGELIATGQPIPEDRQDGLWGVYHFKRAFTEQIVYFVGAYDYVYNPLIHRVTTLATNGLGSLDQAVKLAERFF